MALEIIPSRVIGVQERLNASGMAKAIFSRPDASKANSGLPEENSLSAILLNMLRHDPGRGKNLLWMAQWYARGDYLLEDLPRVRDALIEHRRVRKLLTPEQADVSRFKSLHDLEDLVMPLGEENSDIPSSREEERRERTIVMQETVVLEERDDFMAVVPTTMRAARWWGRGTRWCTAARDVEDNRFFEYNDDGPLVVMRWRDGTKWQMHASDETNSNLGGRVVFNNMNFYLLDERDRPPAPKDVEERIDDIWPYIASILQRIEHPSHMPEILNNRLFEEDDIVIQKKLSHLSPEEFCKKFPILACFPSHHGFTQDKDISTILRHAISMVMDREGQVSSRKTWCDDMRQLIYGNFNFLSPQGQSDFKAWLSGEIALRPELVYYLPHALIEPAWWENILDRPDLDRHYLNTGLPLMIEASPRYTDIVNHFVELTLKNEEEGHNFGSRVNPFACFGPKEVSLLRRETIFRIAQHYQLSSTTLPHAIMRDKEFLESSKVEMVVSYLKHIKATDLPLQRGWEGLLVKILAHEEGVLTPKNSSKKSFFSNSLTSFGGQDALESLRAMKSMAMKTPEESRQGNPFLEHMETSDFDKEQVLELIKQSTSVLKWQSVVKHLDEKDWIPLLREDPTLIIHHPNPYKDICTHALVYAAEKIVSLDFPQDALEKIYAYMDKHGKTKVILRSQEYLEEMAGRGVPPPRFSNSNMPTPDFKELCLKAWEAADKTVWHIEYRGDGDEIFSDVEKAELLEETLKSHLRDYQTFSKEMRVASTFYYMDKQSYNTSSFVGQVSPTPNSTQTSDVMMKYAGYLKNLDYINIIPAEMQEKERITVALRENPEIILDCNIKRVGKDVLLEIIGGHKISPLKLRAFFRNLENLDAIARIMDAKRSEIYKDLDVMKAILNNANFYFPDFMNSGNPPSDWLEKEALILWARTHPQSMLDVMDENGIIKSSPRMTRYESGENMPAGMREAHEILKEAFPEHPKLEFMNGGDGVNRQKVDRQNPPTTNRKAMEEGIVAFKATLEEMEAEQNRKPPNP